MLRYVLGSAVVAAAFLVSPAIAGAQDTPDAQYMALMKQAAPAAVVQNATIMQMQKDGTMRTLQTGTNGFTCMALDPKTPMCADKNAMAWAQAFMTHATPPAGVGFVYMLAGDDGASNTDPYAHASTADNHWVTTGPHVMIVGAGVTSMGYPATADANPANPFVMWANTPYAHLMIPVSSTP
jgi:hypothetical protein